MYVGDRYRIRTGVLPGFPQALTATELIHQKRNILCSIGRAGGTRTHTEKSPHAPQACLSTSSSTARIIMGKFYISSLSKLWRYVAEGCHICLTNPLLFFGVAPSSPQCYGNLKELPVNPGVAFPGHHYWQYCLSRMQLRDVSPSYLLFQIGTSFATILIVSTNPIRSIRHSNHLSYPGLVPVGGSNSIS